MQVPDMAKSKLPQFEKEKIIEKRIGIRLDGLRWPIDRNAIRETLGKLNYKEIDVLDNNIFRAVKHGTVFYADFSRLVFGFRGRNAISLIESQKEFFAAVKREYLTDISEYARFYETESLSNVITDSETSKAFEKISADVPMKTSVEKILDVPLRLNKFELTSPKTDNPDRLDLIEVSPNNESNGKMYRCRLLSRGRDVENPYRMLHKSSDFFEQIIKKLES